MYDIVPTCNPQIRKNVAGINKKPHRVAAIFSELFYTFERSRRALSDAIFAGPQFLEPEKLQGFKVSVKKLRFRFSRPQRDGFSFAQVQS
jgi:hypothetical protein